MAIDTKKNAETGGATVTVASKLAMDFILRLYAFKSRNELVMGGGSREVKQAEVVHGVPEYTIQGNSWAQNKGPHQQIASGYAITHGIPKEFWERWLEQNKESDVIRNGIIFAHAESASTMAEAREKVDVTSGMERLDPNKLPKGLRTADRASA